VTIEHANCKTKQTFTARIQYSERHFIQQRLNIAKCDEPKMMQMTMMYDECIMMMMMMNDTSVLPSAWEYPCQPVKSPISVPSS